MIFLLVGFILMFSPFVIYMFINLCRLIYVLIKYKKEFINHVTGSMMAAVMLLWLLISIFFIAVGLYQSQ